MKKKFAAFVLCVICLLAAAGCGQTKTDEQTPPAADQSTTTDDYLTGIGGTYVELFPELSKSEYRNIWIDATAPLVGAENAEATTICCWGCAWRSLTVRKLRKNTRQIRAAWRSTAIFLAASTSS